ncbi:MAG: hypothetical protein H0X63_08230 [Flavobacteriales bacterium]|nr:hypothetical protein [Flavobacteriales bacterium]
MEATISEITKKLKTAPQEILDRILHYLNTVDSLRDGELPLWQKELLDKRLNDIDNPECIHPIDKLYTFLNAD